MKEIMPKIKSVTVLRSLFFVTTILTAKFIAKAESSGQITIDGGNESDCPVIKTTLGSISGIRQQTVLGNSTFCSYRGIPYGQAPIGELRFKAPLPSEPWEGTYYASEYGAACFQDQSNLIVNMSEDCLFLNVFVPDPSICTNSSDVAAIVFIHGGGFMLGTAYDHFYGPHLLMNECVILVTLHYRLAVFGFLPLALPEYSGNMGLKDQQLALEWISQHISAFGGNPKRVTLMGHSAGAASVSFQKLNPKSRSLFKQAYIMSSSALSYYVLAESNNRTDFIVGLAKNQGIIIENSEQLIDYIRNVDAKYIISKTSQNSVGGYDISFNVAWQPCIEPKTTSVPFITENPEILLFKEVNVPSVYTYTGLESIGFALDAIANPKKISFLDKNFSFPLPFHGLDQEACRKEIAPIFTEIRRFYFGHATINALQILPFIQLISYTNFAYFIHKEVALQALSNSKTKIRLLRINLRTELAPNLRAPGVAALADASHADDICSYFWCRLHSHTYDEVEAEESLLQKQTLKASKILRELLTSFAITGNPVSKTASFPSFPTVNSKPLTNLPFTELLSVSALVSGSNPEQEEFAFWWEIDKKVDKIKKMTCNQK